MTVTVTGLAEVIGNLNQKLSEITNHTMAGLLDAAALIRADMDNTPPVIPVDTNNLRSSWSVVSHFSMALISRQPYIVMGFTASYAVFVHEMVGNDIQHFQTPRPGAVTRARQAGGRPGAGAKFFEAALNRNLDEMLKKIKERASF